MKKVRSILAGSLIFAIMAMPTSIVSAREPVGTTGEFASDDIKVTGYKYISKLNYKSMHSITGTIKAPAYISKVRVGIYGYQNSSWSKCEESSTYIPTKNTGTVSLSKLDSGLEFQKVSYGKKKLKIFVTVKGKEYQVLSDTFDVSIKDLKVIGSKISIPKQIKSTQDLNMSGKITSNYTLTSYGVDLKSTKSPYSNGCFFEIGSSKVGDLSKVKTFHKLDKGTYNVEVFAVVGIDKKVIYKTTLKVV